MVILVFYVGYRRGLHFIYIFAVLFQTDTVVVVLFCFCRKVLICKEVLQ